MSVNTSFIGSVRRNLSNSMVDLMLLSGYSLEDVEVYCSFNNTGSTSGGILKEYLDYQDSDLYSVNESQ